MRRWMVVAVVLGLVGAPAWAEGQGPPDRQQRDRLEEQVRSRFLTRVAQRLELTDAQRDEVFEVLREGAEARRGLAERSRSLRHDLMQAVRVDDTPMSTYEALLDRLEEIRARERAIEREETERLSGILDPRQQAVFLILRMQFNERIREMRGRHRQGGGPGSGPHAGGGAPF